MKKIRNYPEGIFSWVDLASGDLEASKDFYSKVLGWEAKDTMWPEESGNEGIMYVNFYKDGQKVAGMGKIQEELAKKGIPPHWMSYINVKNSEEIAEKVKKAGGKVEMEPMNIMDYGKMAVFIDPTGAVFGTWEAGSHKGADDINKPGCFIWNELTTDDVETAKKFYTEVFGWDYESSKNSDGAEYLSAKLDGRMNGGVMEKPEDAKDMPNAWQAYFHVEDLEKSLEIVKENGGSVVWGPVSQDVGDMAFIFHPMNGGFYLMQSHEIDEVPEEWYE